MRRAVTPIVACVIVLLAGCDWVPRKVAMNDPRIQPLLKAAQSCDRPAEGFTPKPRAADVRWELRPTAAYDATLHITAKTARTVAFRRLDSGWSWIGDQEIFDGPKMVKTLDGTFPEHICLTYEVKHISGAPPNRLMIDSLGEDPRLAHQSNLTLSDIRPILKDWGY
jgi:hypothetical protein